ncbi:MAG: DUF4058 family protein, partial [Chloroflexi bacterium]|nr:DUF4058 family protein [Chloroflexota bacterium]
MAENEKLQPFPGMDPYLEAPDIWPDFHNRLATALSTMLNAQLLVPYYARLQKRSEPSIAFESGTLAGVLHRTDPLEHYFVEIYNSAQGHRLVTIIEIVSPSNKRPGPDRRSYETKQKDVLESNVNLIELDLLRSGRRLLPYPDLVAMVDTLAPDYLVLLNRGVLRQGNWVDYTLYPV